MKYNYDNGRRIIMETYSKAIIIGIITLLITSPITSSTNILTTQNQQNPQNKPTTTMAQNITNPKIVEILEKINETMIKNYMQDLLSVSPRMTGTYGCEKAAEYIYQQFKNTGMQTRYHDWESFGNRWNPGFFKAQNVEATLKGTDENDDEILIFNAHYDTVKVAPGANDDGSGTVAVMAAAYVLSQYQFNRTIKFVTFSGEEIGLRGSRAYVEELYENDTDILVEFNADMIGHAVTSEGGKAMGFSTTEDVEWIPDIIEKLSIEIGLNFQINRGKINREHSGWSDYGPFTKYGYEAVACWGSDRDPNMHEPEDDITNVNISYLVNTTKHIAGVLVYLADFENSQPQIKIANPRRGRLYYEDRTIKDLRFEKTMVFNDVLICTEVKPGDSAIDRVEFYYDGKLKHTDTEIPFQWRLNKFSIWKHDIKVEVYDEQGKNASDTINFYFFNANKNK